MFLGLMRLRAGTVLYCKAERKSAEDGKQRVRTKRHVDFQVLEGSRMNPWSEKNNFAKY